MEHITANLYGNYGKDDIRLIDDIKHFAKKHGCIPNKVYMPAELLPDTANHITIVAEDGTSYTVELELDANMQAHTYLVMRVGV